MILPDTSVWVAQLRRRALVDLEPLLEQGEVMVCGPVVAELLAGTSDGDRDRLATQLRALPWARLDDDAWLACGRVAARLRAAGTPVALTDVTIAVASLGRATLWTADRDFERIAAVEPALDLRLLAP